MGHNEEECRSFNLMMKRTRDAYRVQANAQGNECYGYHGSTPVQGNFRGCGCGVIPGRGCGQIIFYNCNQLGHVSRECQNLTTTCHYCRAVDHMIEACPWLIAKMQERNAAPTQNIQMIVIEKQPISAINVVTRNGGTTELKNKCKELDRAWIRKTPEKVPDFDVRREKDTFMEAREDFADPITSVSTAHQHQQ